MVLGASFHNDAVSGPSWEAGWVQAGKTRHLRLWLLGYESQQCNGYEICNPGATKHGPLTSPVRGSETHSFVDGLQGLQFMEYQAFQEHALGCRTTWNLDTDLSRLLQIKKKWPFGLCLKVLGRYLMYCWDPGTAYISP